MTKRRRTTAGQKIAEHVAKIVGSWPFLISQSVFLVLWMTVNVIAYKFQWDPYPFILLNLLLSTQAAFTAPLIMIAQNRHDELDRDLAVKDHQMILKVHEHLCHQDDILEEIKNIQVQNKNLQDTD